jgi:predicted ABC-class ATPase
MVSSGVEWSGFAFSFFSFKTKNQKSLTHEAYIYASVFIPGKSTLLQAIAVGQYDKIPGDGRELCVSLPDAVTVRAEDGRYVNNWCVQYSSNFRIL